MADAYSKRGGRWEGLAGAPSVIPRSPAGRCVGPKRSVRSWSAAWVPRIGRAARPWDDVGGWVLAFAGMSGGGVEPYPVRQALDLRFGRFGEERILVLGFDLQEVFEFG